MPNLFHRIGDAVERLAACIKFAIAALTGRFPLPTPFERITMSTILARLAALESRTAALELGAAGNTDLVAKASSDASGAVTEVAALADRVAVVEGEIGTDAPADPAPVPVEPVADPVIEPPVLDLNPNLQPE